MMRSPKSPAQLTAQELANIGTTGQQLRQLHDELGQIFAERDELIWQVIFALLTREHVLIHGDYGTGKSDLLNTFLARFLGATTFSIDLTKFMSEGHLVGMPNPKVIRDEGKLRYEPEGSILTAHFALLDELFDAPAPLLRVLLGILNERMFKRGMQIEEAMLHTAVAATNGNPTAMIERYQELGAVVDRFMFHNFVDDVRTDAGRIRMYEQYLRGGLPTITLPYADLDFMSAVVVGANQIQELSFIVFYDQVIEALKRSFERRISPRRACKALQLVEAQALLLGRIDVHPEDTLAIRYALCMGGKREEAEKFQATVEPLIEEHLRGQTPPVDALELATLKELEGFVRSLTTKPMNNLDTAGLVGVVQECNDALSRLNMVQPSLETTGGIRSNLLQQVQKRKSEAVALISAL